MGKEKGLMVMNHENTSVSWLESMRKQHWMLFEDQWILLILLIIVTFFGIINPAGTFFSIRNLRNIMLDASIVMIIGSALTFLLIARGMDLSTGAMCVFSGITVATVMSKMNGAGYSIGLTVACGVICGLFVGTFWGLFNGLVVVKTQIPPFIATLGTQGIILGLAQVWSSGVNVRGVPTQLQTHFGLGRIFGFLPYPVVVTIIIVAIFWVLLRKTRFGMRTYALGANLEGARRVGVNVRKHRIILYVLVGLMCGVVGVIDVSRYNTASVSSHTLTYLNAVSAVLIGGASMHGGRGRMSGTVIGALIPAVLTNGFVVMGIDPFWQNVAMGVVLIVAVVIDQMRRGTDKSSS